MRSQVRQEGPDLRGAHVFGMAFAMKQDKAFDPTEVGLLRTVAQMFQSHDFAHLIEQFQFGLRGSSSRPWWHRRLSCALWDRSWGATVVGAGPCGKKRSMVFAEAHACLE